MSDASLLNLLQNQIDITRVPFSDRGSRLLVYQYIDESALFIKLAERLVKIQPGIESHLRRPPFVENFLFVDEQGDPLEFTASASPEMLTFHTRAGDFRLAFQNETTLAFGLPDRSTAGMRFRIHTAHWRKTDSGGALQHVRDAAYSVNNGRVMKNRVQADGPGSIVEFIVQAEEDCSVMLHIGDDEPPPVLPFSVVCKNARTRWESWFERAPQVNEERRRKYAYAWWVMANNLVSPSGCVKYEAMMPTKAFYIGAWLWDSALHAVAFRRVDPKLARDQIRVMLANQLPDGMLPDAIFDDGVVSEISHPIHARVTKPPIMAWAVLKIHETDPDADFLKEIYEPLRRENAWWFGHNDDDNDGIVQYTHPYSSGLDDNPLWDHGLPVESPDINTYLAIQMNALARMAEIIGRDDEAKEWRRKARELTQRMIEHLWDEETGVFRALHNEKPIPVLTPLNLYPMWTGQLPQEINQRLLAHLQDPSEFWGGFALPTVAYNDPAYRPDKMWRGPVWANINYFFIEALQIVGEHQLANELRGKTLNLIAGQPGIREYYNSQSGEAPGSAAPIFGWSAAVFIELAIQEHAAA
jgi:hypothetical protein